MTGGYKPQTIVGILGIEKQTFRYWRKHLLPNGGRASFTGREVFAMRVLSVLIQEKRFDVGYLAIFPLEPLFDHCRIASLDVLRQSIVIIDTREKELWVTLDSGDLDVHNRSLSWLFLDDILGDHMTSVLDYGITS